MHEMLNLIGLTMQGKMIRSGRGMIGSECGMMVSPPGSEWVTSVELV